jgi:hypothetical protein
MDTVKAASAWLYDRKPLSASSLSLESPYERALGVLPSAIVLQPRWRGLDGRYAYVNLTGVVGAPLGGVSVRLNPFELRSAR